MAFKFVVSLALLSVVSAGVVDLGYNNHYYQQPATATYHQPAAYVQPTATYVQPAATYVKQPALIKQVVQEAPANYEFNYDVHDTHTGDIKRQHEKAENGQIQGEYSLVDADGYRRIVSYTADDHHGFQATVQREPLDHKVLVQPQITKVIQPAVTKIVQPATITKVLQPAPFQPAVYNHEAAYHHSAPVHESYGHHY